jgi:hypothetical protein
MVSESWSVSRHGSLASCERRYFYQYLAQARINSSNAKLREIAWLKQLKTIPAWSGSIFHAQAQVFLEACMGGRQIPADQLANEADRLMRLNWDWSRSAAAQRPPRVGGNVPLFEHQYGPEPDERTRDEAVKRVGSWLAALARYAESSGLLDELRTSVRHWIEPPIFGPGAASVEIDGVTVYTKVDLAFLSREGEFRIVDWKTGRVPTRTGWQSSGEFQVGIYKLWPHLAFKIPTEKIRADLVYIAENPVLSEKSSLTDEDRDLMLSNVRRSIARMRQFADARQDGMELSDLSYASAAGLCRFCNFKGPCIQSLDGGLESAW